MNKKLFLKIAKQIYKIATDLPRIPIPKEIQRQAKNCYYDYINNAGKNGIDCVRDINNCNINCKLYKITNVKEKCKSWNFYNLIKDRFNNVITLYFYDKQTALDKTLTTILHQIVISVDNDYWDIINIKHQLQHYFQHVILDEDKLKQFVQQANNSKNEQQYLLSDGQRIQQIGTCCQRFFDLYMKSYYQQIAFQQFYQKYIENKLQINVDKLKSSRFQNKSHYSMLFLKLVKEKDYQQYNQIKNQIIQYSNQAIKQRQNLQKVLYSKNYALIQNLILENKQDQSFIKNAIDILIKDKKTKLLTVIIEHFQLFDLINYNEIQFNQLLNIVKNCKKQDSKKEIVKNIVDTKNIQLIMFFIKNIRSAINQPQLLQQCSNILSNWIFVV